MRLLAFDDDDGIGRLVTRVATMLGLEAAAVTEAPAFHQSLQAQSPDIVMLDLQLGPTDGVEQVRWLAQRGFTGALILMSGFDARVLDSASALARTLGLSVAGTLLKPIEVDDLETLLLRLQGTLHRPTLEGILGALEHGEMSLEFQPIVSRRRHELRKLEALIRWDHPKAGRIWPTQFVAIAEASPEAIDKLTDWVLAAAMQAWQSLRAVGIEVPIAVNVSSQNLHDITLPDRLAARLQVAGMPPEMLCLEITETAAFADATRAMDILVRLRLKGMLLALDDFGTGYSSLKILRQLPFSTIKIDQSFVADLETSRDSRAIVKSIVDLAANMELESVAEGVQTEAAAGILEAMGVDSLQGHLIAASMPVDAVAHWLQAWRKL